MIFIIDLHLKDQIYIWCLTNSQNSASTSKTSVVRVKDLKCNKKHLHSFRWEDNQMTHCKKKKKSSKHSNAFRCTTTN